MTLLDELVRHLYVDLGQSTGGPLHIVLDDGNVDDQWLADDETRYAFLFDGRFEEYAQPGEDVSEGRRREIRDTCELILAVLRRMSLPERSAAVRAAYNAATGDPTITLVLSEAERRYLAMHARYRANHEEDPRYWNQDRVERARLLARWRAIADELHPDPWGQENPE